MEKRKAPELPCPQRNTFAFKVGNIDELRAATGDTITVRGVASVYNNQYEVYGGPAQYGWYERVATGAFDKTLAENPDVVFLINHYGMPLARTKSGTLDLTAGKKGLEVESELDLSNPLVQTLRSALERKDITEMSFEFRVTKQTWEAHPDFPDDEMSLRTIQEVNLNRGDVSAVTYGANPATTIDVTRSLQLANDAELEEYQALIVERLALRTPGGMPAVTGKPGGMPAHLVAQLLQTH